MSVVVHVFTSAWCTGSGNDQSCTWGRRYDGTDDRKAARVLAAARRHGGPGHVVLVERGTSRAYGSNT